MFVASDKRGVRIYFSYCPQKLNLVLIRSALVSTSYEYYNVHFHREIRKIHVLRFWLKKKKLLYLELRCVLWALIRMTVPLSIRTYDAQPTKKALLQFANNFGPGQHVHLCSLI